MTLEIIGVGPLKRMVFTNPYTDKLYHGLGRQLFIKFSIKPTSVSDIKNYAE